MAVTDASPLLEGLNPVQREAVLHGEGPVLIVAGAGSGKTRALTHRIAYLIRERGVSPSAILAITFTNKAAREMAERVEALVGERVASRMWISTFHSACARILRREHEHLGLPSAFTIYDEGDTERLLAQVLKEQGVDPRRYPPRAVAAAIGRAKDRVLSAEDFARLASGPYEETVARAYLAYEERKRAAGALPGRSTSTTSSPRPSGCSGRGPRCSPTTRSGSATSWSTSTRTRTGSSTSS